MMYSSRARSRSPRRGPRSRQKKRSPSKVQLRNALIKQRTKTQRDVNQVLKLFLWVVHTFRGGIRRSAKALSRPINFGAGLAYVILDCLLLGAFFMVGAISYLMTIIITRLNPEARGAFIGSASDSSNSQGGKKEKRGKRGKNTKTKKNVSTASDEPPAGPMWYVTTFYKMVEDRVKRGEIGEIGEASATLSGDIHFKKPRSNTNNLSERHASFASIQDEEGSSASSKDEEDSGVRRQSSVRGQGSGIRRQSSVRGQGSAIRRQSSARGEGSVGTSNLSVNDGQGSMIKRLSVKMSEIMDDVAVVMQTFDNEEKEANPDPQQQDSDSSE
ncbi:uncharacterized protein [Littorina saxatilis]|uniref:Uncharacterized protein n=1 Tax=Littorina saxatilis TaxID=31220 RepID=A0AAN9ATU1_9CAEN